MLSIMLGIKITRTISSVRLFCKKDNFRQIQRCILKCNLSNHAKSIECLNNKHILRVSGKETTEFLQGLITNDMTLLKESENLYSLFLNIKGRVLYDTIIHKAQEDDVYYLECDSNVAEQLQKHLKMYRIRRKIDIENMSESMKVWVAFDPASIAGNTEASMKTDITNPEGFIFPCGILNNKASKHAKDIVIYGDPRLSELGFRIIAGSKIEKEEIIKHLNCDISASIAPNDYKTFRYRLGIGEGTDDFPPGKPLPLEVNCDYLHGVSFHKGCYIGQELTARTHHTGVVRKRLMPLTFNQTPSKSFAYDEKITDESGKVVGKFRGNSGIYGIGLMRISEALSAQTLNVLGTVVKVMKPLWWPQESQKESLSIDGRKQ